RSSLTVTSTAVASILMAEMGIPGLDESWAILDQQRRQAVAFMRARAMRLRKTDRLQPKLSDVLTVFNVDVGRFGSLKAIKEEPKVGDSQHGRHSCLKNIRCRSAAYQFPCPHSNSRVRPSAAAMLPTAIAQITAALSAV